MNATTKKSDNFISPEFIVTVFALLTSTLFVLLIYKIRIWPTAASVLNLKDAGEIANNYFSVSVLLKDWEQFFCFILFFAALIILIFKMLQCMKQGKQRDLILDCLPQDINTVDQKALSAEKKAYQLNKHLLQHAPEAADKSLTMIAMQKGLKRIEVGGEYEVATQLTEKVCEDKLAQMDTQFYLINYIAWAIPSIGFIGTVRGIGSALANAGAALGNDISPVTNMLGVAFNSTLIALFLSIFLMLVIHGVKQFQETMVSNVNREVDEMLEKHFIV